MPESRARKGRKPYRPRPPRTPSRSGLAAPPADQAPAKADGDSQAQVTAMHVTDDVARLQRRIIGSDAWLRGIEDHVAQLVNAERRKYRLPALRVDERLRGSSRAHSADMARRRFFDHQAPDGAVPADRIREYGYPHPAAENIARGQPDPPSVMRAWMNSAEHRRNILHPQARSVGVGVYRGPGGPWWTQHFGYE